jgi:hypothetical protein
MKFINARKQKLVYIAKLDFPPIYKSPAKDFVGGSPTPTSKLQRREGANGQDFSFSFGFLLVYIHKKRPALLAFESPS